MNDESWIKLYRKLKDHAIMKDTNALHLFIWTLLNADKKTGEVTFGRFIVAKTLKINPNTLYSALKRCVLKYKIFTIVSTTEYTTIRLLNWPKYQPGKGSDTTPDNIPDNKRDNIPDNTIQEYKNKNINIYSSLKYLEALPDGDIEEFNKKYSASKVDIQTLAESLKSWCETNGRTKKNYRAFLQNRLLDKYGRRPAVAKPVEEEPFVPVTPETLAKFHANRKKLFGGLSMEGGE